MARMRPTFAEIPPTEDGKLLFGDISLRYEASLWVFLKKRVFGRFSSSQFRFGLDSLWT